MLPGTEEGTGRMRHQSPVTAFVFLALLALFAASCDDSPSTPPKEDALLEVTDVQELQEDVAVLCGGVTCEEGFACCDELCVDTRSNREHCGGCAIPCEGGESCEQGACLCTGRLGMQSLCRDTETCCPSEGCLDLSTDPMNCGGCAVSCGLGETCKDAQCTCGDVSTQGGRLCASDEACCGSTPTCTTVAAPVCSCGGVPCGIGQVCCDESCVRVDRDEENCGACGQACGIGQLCSGARCVCQSGFSDCDGDPATGCETQLSADVQNCGACGHLCDPGEVCSRGSCVTSCQVGRADCDGSCVDVLSDRANCGACGNECPAGEVCSAGFCAIGCQNGLQNCAGLCVNIDIDRAHCGACGRECPAGEVCWAGYCAVSCPVGMATCNETCIDTESDRGNCGGCGNVCPAAQSCALGHCVQRCPSGLTDCAGNCVDLDTNRSHCGACQNRCGLGDICGDGYCTENCPAGQLPCGGQCIDPMSNPVFCGATNCSNGAICAENETCNQGTCGCTADFADCNNSLVDGCEAHTPTDEAHCGACFTPCIAGDTCCSSTCVDRETDPTNCGACTVVCPSVPGAAPTCEVGLCSFACNTGLGDCNHNPADGCEFDVSSDLANCGACGRLCSGAGGSATCVGGQCQLACSAGFADCNFNPTDGCETRLGTLSNCSSCGNVCSNNGGTPLCKNKVCEIVCANRREDCNDDLLDGCEADLDADAAHCAGCNAACVTPNATPVCSGGVCAVGQCATDYLDCNGIVDDGCEAMFFCGS